MVNELMAIAPVYPTINGDEGISMREYFAAAALQGMVCNQGWGHDTGFISKKAAAFADALINELNKKDEDKI